MSQDIIRAEVHIGTMPWCTVDLLTGEILYEPISCKKDTGSD